MTNSVKLLVLFIACLFVFTCCSDSDEGGDNQESRRKTAQDADHLSRCLIFPIPIWSRARDLSPPFRPRPFS